jgi:tRNA (guanine-N(7)-)-methyltransferase subunit TRM82
VIHVVEMKIPYNQVHASGTTLFAARGGKLLSFSLADGTHISTWQHPDLEKPSAATEVTGQREDLEEQIDEQQPPAKRQRLDSETEIDTSAADEAVASSEAQEGGEGVSAEPDDVNAKAKGKKNKRKQRGPDGDGGSAQRPPMARAPDRPVITHLASTQDERYMVAVTAHDKTIWTFEHDGRGKLKVLSQR